MRSIFPTLLLTGFILVVPGCGSGTPRFTHTDESQRSPTRETSIRFSRALQEAAQEEQREDDVKVDVVHVDSRFVHPTPEQSRMLREVLRYIGTPYRLGGTGHDGIDCSAYTWIVFRNAAGIELPRSTEDQFRFGRPVPLGQRQFGDLIFFNTTGRNPSHVGVYLGDNLFAHASISYGVTISSLESTYFKRRVTGVRRVLE